MLVQACVTILSVSCNCYPQSFQRCQAAIAATDWVQLAHLNDYEIGWAHMFQLNYERALPLWLKLQEENAWSKAFYCYMAAVCLVELGRHAEARTKFAELSGLITRKIAGTRLHLCCQCVL